MTSKQQNNGMMTKVWGPPGWMFLHAVVFGYPTDPVQFDNDNDLIPGTTSQRYANMLRSIGHVLPCKYCRASYNQYVKELPLTNAVLKDRSTLTRWLYNIHNKVNDKLGLKRCSFNKHAKQYESYRAQCTTGPQKGCITPLSGIKIRSRVLVYPDICLKWIVIITIALALGIFVYRKKSSL